MGFAKIAKQTTVLAPGFFVDAQVAIQNVQNR
jgi:hypothetical protein